MDTLSMPQLIVTIADFRGPPITKPSPDPASSGHVVMPERCAGGQGHQRIYRVGETQNRLIIGKLRGRRRLVGDVQARFAKALYPGLEFRPHLFKTGREIAGYRGIGREIWADI